MIDWGNREDVSGSEEMKTLGNVLWFLFGGGIISFLWFVAAILCFITIIGIPFGIQCLKFAGFILYPFGRTIVYSSNMGHFLVNILWILICGWEIAITSFVIGLIWCITIVGIPFGVQSIKFAQLAIMPFGAQVVK